MKTADMKVGEVYAFSGRRDWDWDSYLSATKVTLLDKRTWYDDTGSMFYHRDRKTYEVKAQDGNTYKVDQFITTFKRQYCKRGVLVRVETGWATGTIKVVPFQQVVALWDEYEAIVKDNAARREQARIAQQAAALKDDADRQTMETYVELLGLNVTVPSYGKPYVKLYIDDLTKLVNDWKSGGAA